MAANGHGFEGMARSYGITTALSPQPALDLITKLTGLCIGPGLVLAARGEVAHLYHRRGRPFLSQIILGVSAMRYDQLGIDTLK